MNSQKFSTLRVNRIVVAVGYPSLCPSPNFVNSASTPTELCVSACNVISEGLTSLAARLGVDR